jgi:hypothetical protein
VSDALLSQSRSHMDFDCRADTADGAESRGRGMSPATFQAEPSENGCMQSRRTDCCCGRPLDLRLRPERSVNLDSDKRRERWVGIRINCTNHQLTACKWEKGAETDHTRSRMRRRLGVRAVCRPGSPLTFSLRLRLSWISSRPTQLSGESELIEAKVRVGRHLIGWASQRDGIVQRANDTGESKKSD